MPGSGLATQLMAAEESTVGTAVTVTRGYEVDNLKPDTPEDHRSRLGYAPAAAATANATASSPASRSTCSST
jgi:hypothetical protein